MTSAATLVLATMGSYRFLKLSEHRRAWKRLEIADGLGNIIYPKRTLFLQHSGSFLRLKRICVGENLKTSIQIQYMLHHTAVSQWQKNVPIRDASKLRYQT